MISRRHLIGASMSAPLIDPVEHIRRIGDESLGVVPQRTATQRQEQLKRFDAESDRTQRLLTFETIEVHCPNVPANTVTAFDNMIATGATTFQTYTFSPDVGAQCRVVAIRVLSNAAITAGTCQLQLRVFDGADTTDYVFAECELSATNPRTKSVVLAWELAPQLAKGSTWFLGANTSSGFLPAGTVDMKAQITFGYEQWVSS